MSLPPRQGLYDPSFERDACGLGFVATLTKEPSHDIVASALEILCNLTHRGAAGCDPYTGDGAGISLQIPDALYRAELSLRGIVLPPPGDYAVAMCFLPEEPAARRTLEATVESAVLHQGQGLLAWRDVPIDPAALGPLARDSAPVIKQLFVERRCAPELFGPTLYMIRKRAHRLARGGLYINSLSERTVVYKGLMLAEQLGAFYRDLADARAVTRLAVVHSRFSTNTFPSWELAHPFRLLAHNGEINTLRGNRAWMESREWNLKSEVWQDLADMRPIIRPGGSDSGGLDNVADFLFASGRSLPHVMMMLVPEAWSDDPRMNDEKKAFYEYHGCLIEPWDGPAALVFTDGRVVGATLDRNGLRPAKYVVTSDGKAVLASELGVLDLDPAKVVEKGRLQPGKMFLVDTEAGRIIADDELKQTVARRRPYRQWLDHNKIDLAKLPQPSGVPTYDDAALSHGQRLFGYTQEDVRLLLTPMAQAGEEPVGSMGIDVPLAVLSREPQLLFRYFKQHFAQVTNPPIDPVREQIVMSLVSQVGGEGNLLEETPRQCRMLELDHPILDDLELAKLRDNPISDFTTATLSLDFPAEGDGGESLRLALARLCAAASSAVRGGASILILSDRDLAEGTAAIPSLLATSAVHHSLMRDGLRARCGLVVETAEVREVHHLALLVGYGAGAVCPYLALATVERMAEQGALGSKVTAGKAGHNFAKAMRKGLLKVMSKMGISTLSSYQGAQIFEAVGIDQLVIDEYFGGTASRLRGIGLAEIALDALTRHAEAWGRVPRLRAGGHYQFRREGEFHLWQPETIASLQKAVRLSDQASYDRYARLINEQQPTTLRSLWDLTPAGPAVPLEEVEPARDLVKHFVTGAMSFGSISKEAHENLAVAMNRLGARSNSGEGGEDPARYHASADGDSRRSSIKQVASARFGVTVDYLVNADDLQIKIAQGAKPGEGGQLPGHKVDATIARVRHSTPGVTLISPPPHHDIYSIEDLAQLVFDLKNVNPKARVSVKLVSEAGVGVVAAGVTKAHADVVVIAGHDGGTGAAPLTSIHHAGVPWELGLAEAQQVLLLNGLRGRVKLQVDGQLRTGRDVVFAALLGAEEFGFATAPLVASGCVMMRKCHLNTCPVGVATQDPELRKRFAGTPEHVINYFFFVAEEARRIMASLGFRSLDEMVGRVECIVPRKVGLAARHRRLDFSEVLYKPREAGLTSLRCLEGQTHDIDRVLDRELINRAQPALAERKPVSLATTLRNRDRAFGSMLSGEVARRHGPDGLPEDTITISASGTAGQSFGAFLARGVSVRLEGDANDYVGKGLSGGVIAITPPPASTFAHHEQVIVGNTVLYGATAGKAFFNGRAGERFAVRNSGATTVVEGVGDHGCEYMTGGTVLVLGPVGRNFGAGMSGGVAFVVDERRELEAHCHSEIAGDVDTPTAEDLGRVRTLLEEHHARTGSPRAAELLSRFQDVSRHIRRILPLEYRRALEERARKEGVAVTVGTPAAEPAPGGATVSDLAAERRARVAHG